MIVRVRGRDEMRVLHLFTAGEKNGKSPSVIMGTLCGERHNHRTFIRR